jgi:hypothetical protein
VIRSGALHPPSSRSINSATPTIDAFLITVSLEVATISPRVVSGSGKTLALNLRELVAARRQRRLFGPRPTATPDEESTAGSQTIAAKKPATEYNTHPPDLNIIVSGMSGIRNRSEWMARQSRRETGSETP